MENNVVSAERISVLREPQNYIIPILKMLQENGGELENYSQMDKLMPLYTDITENEMNYSKITDKGNKYVPYWIGRNFAVKQLALVGYVTHDRGLPIKLTTNGMNLNIDEIDVERDINAKIKPYVDKKNQERRENRVNNTAIKDDEEEEEAEAEELNNETDQGWRDEILNNVKNLDPYKFEHFSRGLLMKMGFDIDPKKGVRRSGDGGIDGFGYCLDKQSLKTIRVAIQCKKFQDNHPVGSADINSLRGAVDTHRADYGIFITTSYYTSSAKESSRAGGTPITLIDGDELVNLMTKYKYKVKEVTIYTPDQDFFES